MGNKVVIGSVKPENTEEYEFRSIFSEQLIELAEVRNPSAKESELKDLAAELEKVTKPVYVYYQWRGLVIECAPEDIFVELKTNRNQYLITKEEQKKLYGAKISIAGMSVGSSLTYGLVGSGFGRNLNIADDDKFSTTNLNRVQATLLDVEEYKVDVAARRALEMNPFLDIKTFSDRITEKNMNEFMFDGEVDMIFEEIDDFKMKIVLREQAKKFKIPFVMLTNLGDSVMIDVERYDSQPETVPFNGFVDVDLLEEIKNSEITQEMMKRLSVALVDKSLIPERAMESLKEIGVSLVGRPQLYGTVALDGGIAPYILRKIILENEYSSGRYKISLKDIA